MAAVVVLAALGMVFAVRSILAVAETRVVSSQADWEAGEFYNNTLDTTSTAGSLTIKSGGVGTWDASTPGFPENLRGNYGLASEPADIGADLTTDGSYIYMIVGGRQPDFFRYNPDTNTWKQLADAPTPFLYSSAITYYDGAVYAINGNDGLSTTDATGAFFKYDIYTDTWSTLSSAPDVWGSTSAQGGADIESGNNGKLYAVQGGGQSGFFIYDTQTNAWSSGTSVPDPVNATTSHPLVFSDTTFNITGTDYCTTGCIYTILGGNNSFLRYDIALEQWFTGFTTVPAFFGTYAAGSAMAFDSTNDDIYMFRGGTTEFAKYDVNTITGTGGTWDAATGTTENTQRATAAGASMIYLNGYVYATLGGVPEFTRYDVSSPKWEAIITQAATSTTGDNLISFVPNGADCSDASGCLFVAQANAAAPIRRYLIGARTWAASVNSTPAALSTGSAMCYDGSGNLYIVRGGGGANTQVYSFPINAALDQAFATLTAPAAAGAGADIACTANDRFYMLHGNGGVLFSYYNGATIAAENAINANGEPYVNVSYGAALSSNRTDVADATDVYALVGNGRGVLLKYNIAGDTWDELTNMPTAPGTNIAGAQYTNTLVYDRTDNLYVFPGKMSKEVWRYDISGNSWSRAADAPVRLGRSHGATFGNAAGAIYLMRGENWNGIHKFNSETDDFIPAATWVSAPMDLHFVSSFTSLTSNATLNGNTINFWTRTSDDGAGWSAWASVSGTTIASAANRYIQVKAQLNSAAGDDAPVLQDFTITYEKDSTAPANPTVSAWTSSAKTTTLTTPASTFATNPYFEFTPATQTESPLAGYYVAWTSGASCSSFNPSTSEDYFQTGTTYTVNSSVVNGTQYCLRVVTKDVAGNVSSPENLFLYTYTGISPAATRQWSTQADFAYTGTTATDVNTNASSGTALELSAVTSGAWSSEAPLPAAVSNGAAIVGDGNGSLYILRGAGQQTFYHYNIGTKVITAKANYGAAVNTGASAVYVPSGATGCADASGCVFATRGATTTEWRRYDITANTWTAASPGAGSLTALPLTAANGASLAYNGSDTIYYLGGSTAPSTRFYSYNLGTGVWTQRSDVDQTVGLGGTLAYVPTNTGTCTSTGGCVYATRGNNTSHFWKGAIAANGSVTWTYTTNIPVWTGDGAAIRRVGSYLYLLRGTSGNDFYRFDLTTSAWTRMPNLPTIKGQGSEQGLAYDTTTNTLFVLRGYNVEATMLAFDISRNVWKGTAIPHGYSTAGFSTGAMAYDTQTGLVYAGRGQTFSDWWQLNPTTNAWLRKADVPHTLSTGADAEYVNHSTDSYDGVYVLTGNEAQGDNVGYFYRYNPTTDTWTRLTNMNNAGAAVEPAAGADLVWDGADAIYTALGTSTAFYKYTISTNSWSNLSGANQPLWLANGAGSCAARINVGGTEYIYLTRGVTTAAVYRFNIGTQQWDAAGTVENSPNLLVGDACVNDGQGNLLFPRGASGVEMYVLDPDGDANGVWTTRAVPQTYTNGNLVMTSNNVILGNRGTSTSAIDRYIVATASTGYEDFGQWTSEILDFGAGLYGYGGLAVNAAEATSTTMLVETRTCSDSGCAASATDSHWGAWTAVTNTHPVGTVDTSTVASTLARYGQVRITFRSDQVSTPTVYDVTWSSYTDGTDPTNPVSASAYTDNGKTVTITPGNWTSDATPYFEWTASDNAGGIGLEGFYVYFGTDNSCTDPSGAACNASNLAHVSGSHYYAVAGDGVTGSWNAASQISTALTSGTYYLKIMARDRNSNITDAAAAGFTYQVDITNPSAPGSIVATPAGYSSLNSFGFTWTAGSDTGGSGINQYCYTTEGPGAVETCVSAATLSVANIQAYQARANVFKVRSRDAAGNYSAAYASVNYYFSGNTPAAPQGLVVTPTSQTDNNTFSFSWGLPSNCLGQTPCDEADILRYCYTLNELPSATACGYNTAGSATPSPDGGWTTSSQTTNRSLPAFSAATKQGANTFYLIAADAIGNIDYTAFASVDFTFTSTAPGAPGSVQAIDSSDRSTKRYSVTLTWDEPTEKGSGVEQYAMYRCTKESATATNCDSPSTTDEPPTNYERIATTQNLGYLDLGLDSTKVYAYFLRAVGTGGALSGNSSVVAEQPEGRYTTPPAITEGPIVLPDSFAAVVTWRTERTASSFVEFGTTVDALSKEQGTATQIDAHEVRVTGLQPKTTYFFRVKSIDIDENIAYSSVGQFTTLEAPRVENVKITDVRLNDAIISWTTTKESTAVIQYGPTTDYGFTFTAANSFSTTHTVKLENLRDGTTYHLRLEGKDRADNPIASDDYNFTTLTFPKILTVSAENKAEGQTEVKWTTNVQTTSEVEYYNENAAPKTQGNSSLVREHSILVFGLEDATEYKFKVRGRDQFGYEAVSGENKFRTLEDTTPPVISEVKSESNTVGSGDAAKIQIIVSWKTNEPTTSQVQYGEGLAGASYSAETDENAERVRDHLVVIGGLTPAKTYHFRVVSKDKAGNESKSQGYSILTSRARQSFLQIVIGNLEDTFSWLGGIGKLFGG